MPMRWSLRLKPCMAKLSRRLHHARDLTRRWTRRGVARSVLEHKDNVAYMETHPIAEEMARTYGTKKIERFATEQHFDAIGSQGVMSMAIDHTHPKAARWPA